MPLSPRSLSGGFVHPAMGSTVNKEGSSATGINDGTTCGPVMLTNEQRNGKGATLWQEQNSDNI